jgi:hypothetical protein
MKYVPSYLLPKGIKASKAGIKPIEDALDAGNEAEANKFDAVIASGVLGTRSLYPVPFTDLKPSKRRGQECRFCTIQQAR